MLKLPHAICPLPCEQNMHIVYLIHQFLPRHIGGAEIYTLGLARLARKAGHTVTVITYHESSMANSLGFGPHYTAHEEIPVIEIHYNLSMSPHPARYEYDNVYTASVLQHVLKKLKPDLVHVMHAMKISASSLNVCGKLGIPFIVTLCDYWFICPRHTLLKWDLSLCEGPSHPLYCLKCVQELHGFAQPPHFLKDLPVLAKRSSFIRKALLKAKRIIALSDFQKKMHVQNGLPAERIEVIRHGLDQFDNEPAIDPYIGPLRIGYIGSLVEHKGVHLLLQALAQIPHEELVCKIYGAQDDSAYVASLHEIAKKDKRIEFMGAFPSAQLAHILSGLDILAAPFIWYENEPLVIKAALSRGMPTICNNIGSLSEMIIHEKTGWLVADKKVETWAVAIQQALVQFPQIQMQPAKIKTIEENANELLSIYAEEAQ
jgi:glycosyltransferase involved in cell wall biosynthesis